MANFFKQLFSHLPKEEPLKAGMYTYHTPPEAPEQLRLHLRVEPNGEGVLIINASTVLHLNQTGTEIAYCLMQGKKDEEIIDHVSSRFYAPYDVIEKDVVAFHKQLSEIIHQPDQIPEAGFGLELIAELKDISAPYQLCCCLTSSTEDNFMANDQTPNEELDTDAWKALIKKAYDAGIPHLIFYGGEPSLRNDLIELLEYCEELGLVSGLVSSGRKLADDAYLQSLLTSGLDHLMVPYDPANEVLTQALEKILPQDLYTCVGLTISADTEYQQLISTLMQKGANAFSLLPADEASFSAYLRASDYSEQIGSIVVTDLPFPLAQQHLVALRDQLLVEVPEKEFVQLDVSASGELSSRPHFDTVLGNMLTEDWQTLWNRRYQNQTSA